MAPFLNRVILGDCLQVLRTLPDSSVDFVLTDPPYLVRYQDRTGRIVPNDDNARWLYPAFAELCRVLKPNAYCVSFYGWSQADKFLAAWRMAGLAPCGHIVWTKSYPSGTRHLQSRHEQAYLLAKGSPVPPMVAMPDVLPWRYSGNHLHPTQKPVESLKPIIEAFCPAGGVVLDPFAGSGSTGVAAKECGRRFVLIEKHQPYHQAAASRLA